MKNVGWFGLSRLFGWTRQTDEPDQPVLQIRSATLITMARAHRAGIQLLKILPDETSNTDWTGARTSPSRAAGRLPSSYHPQGSRNAAA